MNVAHLSSRNRATFSFLSALKGFRHHWTASRIFMRLFALYLSKNSLLYFTLLSRVSPLWLFPLFLMYYTFPESPNIYIEQPHLMRLTHYLVGDSPRNKIRNNTAIKYFIIQMRYCSVTAIHLLICDLSTCLKWLIYSAWNCMYLNQFSTVFTCCYYSINIYSLTIPSLTSSWNDTVIPQAFYFSCSSQSPQLHLFWKAFANQIPDWNGSSCK